VHRDVVIIGACQAGAQVAISLRKGGFTGSVLLAGDEALAPYTRPPLSKELLFGEREPDGLFLREPEYWRSAAIELRTTAAASEVDADARAVSFADGMSVSYENLVLATGGSARRLPVPGASLPGVLTVRSLSDARALRAEITHAKQAVVVGGGYLGLEIAAALRMRGLGVTLAEVQETLLSRTASPALSGFYIQLHRGHGVNVRTGVVIDKIRGQNGRVSDVVLAGGEVLPANIVVVATGMVANDHLLRVAGAECDAGVLVDRSCRTSLPHIYAAGDCAMRVNEYGLPETYVRLESVQNAIAQARLVARDILGLRYETPSVPWFWSDQYETKMKSVGLNHGHDELVVEDDPLAGTFVVSYLRNGTPVARDCINTHAGYGQLKKALEHRYMQTDAIARGTTV
jgi:3-phenylpropionate/trans-cinnamate dioxygenase ferredoxin reductase subunit